MAKRFTKSDITIHSSQEYTGPAINVKVYQFPHDAHPAHDRVMAEFGCDRPTAEKALEYAWEAAQERFWELMRENHVPEIFGPDAKAYSMGRSGGWLYVESPYFGPCISGWSARMVAKWGRLVRMAQAEIDYLTSWEYVKGEIEANRWAEPGAEKYNFIDTPSDATDSSGEGTPATAVCVVDAKRIARAAPKLLAALKSLQAALTEHGLRNVRKRFSLCIADAEASSAIAEAEGRAS